MCIFVGVVVAVAATAVVMSLCIVGVADAAIIDLLENLSAWLLVRKTQPL